MGVNWLTVLNTVLNVGVWIKRTERGEKREVHTTSLFLFSFFSPHRSVLHDLILPADMAPSLSSCDSWNIKDLDLPSFILPFLSPHRLLFFSPSAVSLLSYPIFCHLPGFIPQQWGWKLHFSWNVSCCKAPAGVIFFCRGENIRLHLLHFMYVNQNSDAHLRRPARWCI